MQTKRVLRKKLALLFLGIAIVPFLLATTQALVKFQNSQRESIILQERRIASDAAKEIASFIRLQFAGIESIDEFQQHFPENEQFHQALIEHTLFSRGDFFELSVVSREGKELVRAHRIKVIAHSDLRDWSNSKEFHTVRKDRRYIGPIFWENNKPFFIIGEGTFSSKNEFLGAVFAQLDARLMQSIVRGLSVSEEFGQASIFDRNGTVIANQDFSKVALKENFSHVGIVAEALKSEERRAVAGIFKNEQGEEVIGASEPIRVLFGDGSSGVTLDTAWFVVAEIPSYIALASVRDSTIFSLVILMAVLFAAIIAALILARRMVKPIEQLRQVIQEFRDGHLEYKISLKTGDEIEDLATSFYTMADELRVSIKTITEDKQIIEAEKHQLERIISGITDAVIVTDIEGKIIIFNKIAEALTGYAMRDVMQMPVDEIVSIWQENSRLKIMAVYADRSRLSNGILLQRDDLLLLGKEGREAHVNLVIGTIEDGKQVNVGRIITLHDTSRERYLEQLKIEFISLVAHQFRTPLAIIKWGLDDLIEGGRFGKVSAEQRKFIEQLTMSGDHLIRLITDILDVIHIEAGQFGLQYVPHSLKDLVEEVYNDAKDLAEKKGLEFVYKCLSPQFPLVSIDPSRMRLVLQNLLENAIKYTPKGGKVLLTISLKGSQIEVIVKDNGIGIAKEYGGRVFEKFFRSPQAVRFQPGGTGLGLFITRNIIAMHGGKIWFYSEEGKGATFGFTVPVYIPPKDATVGALKGKTQ